MTDYMAAVSVFRTAFPRAENRGLHMGKYELTVYQMVAAPETKTLRLRLIGGQGWTQIDLSGFPEQTETPLTGEKKNDP